LRGCDDWGRLLGLDISCATPLAKVVRVDGGAVCASVACFASAFCLFLGFARSNCSFEPAFAVGESTWESGGWCEGFSGGGLPCPFIARYEEF
jgi:hypothetical protein